MATIQMTGGFNVCPEGRHIFRIYRVDYDKDFGRVSVFMVTAQGNTHVEKFFLMGNNGEMNDKACNAFSFFAKTALNNFSVAEIDHTDLIDRYIGAEITHTVSPNRNDPSKTVTFANIGEKWVVDGFDTVPCKKALTLGKAPTETPTPSPTPTGEVNLDNLLD